MLMGTLGYKGQISLSKCPTWYSSILKRQRRAWLLHLQATHSLAEEDVARPHGRSKWKPEKVDPFHFDSYESFF